MLTTKEFTQKVEELDEYTVKIREQNDGRMVSVYDSHNVMADIHVERMHVMSIHEHISPKLFNLIAEYAQTPLDKREKKGRLWFKNGVYRRKEEGLNYNYDKNKLSIVYWDEDKIVCTESQKEDIERKTGIKLEFIEE